MTCAHRFIFLAILVVLTPGTVSGQVQTGTPPFGSFGGGPDTVNLGNLNAHYSIPVRHKAGRGINFDYDLTYDSSVWKPVASTWQPTSTTTAPGWQGLLPAGQSYIGYSMTYSSGHCGYMGQSTYQTWTYNNFFYIDNLGQSHGFSLNIAYISSPGPPNCPPSGPQPNFTVSSLAGDGSGFTLYVAAAPCCGGTISAHLVDKSGSTISPPVGTSPSGSSATTDRNGNQITSINGAYTDTLGTQALAVIGTAPSNTNISYTAPSGAVATYVVSYHTYTVRTNFGCSGITEYNALGTAQSSLVDRVTLPDGSFYQFVYETTPGDAHSPHHVSGRAALIQLPTGGTIQYAYSGGNNGITCSDGSAATVTRTTPDGTWTYAKTLVSGTQWQTIVTDPQGNQTALQFQGIYETQQKVYQGSSTSGTVLRTTNTCYNSSASPCTGTAVLLPIARRTQIVQLPDTTGKQCKYDHFYSSSGLLTEVDDYDYGASGGSVGSLIRKTLISYAALGNGILDRRSSVTVQDGGSVTKAQATFTYDETTAVVTSGTPQHVPVTGSRGNATTVKNYKDATNFLTSNATYFDTGNVQIATNVNNAQTTYTYGTCGNSFPTSVSEPLSLSVSAAWNCTGAVLTSFTDENGKQTTVAYSDPYFWRPASSTDPTNAVANLTYNGQGSVESALSFNAGGSTVDVLKTLDGLGRVHVQQTRQSPGSANFDSVEQDFDSLGRTNRTTLPYSATTGGLNLSGPATTRTYDGLGRVLTLADAGGGSTSYSYTQIDTLATVSPAPTGESTKRRQLEYDGLGRLTSLCEITAGYTGAPAGSCGQTVSQTGYLTKYTYDVLGNLLTVTQNAQATSGYQQSRIYTYDFLRRLKSENNPETGTTTYTFDTDATCGTSSGDPVKRVDAVGNTSCLAYDVLHRVISATYPSGSYASPVTANKYFVYDTATVNLVPMANGKTRLVEAYTAATQAGTKITDAGFSYSARGEVGDVYQSTPHSGGYYHLGQTYWANGSLNQLSGSLATLPTFTYGVNGEGRPNSASASSGLNPVTSTLYNVFGQPYQVNFGSLDSDSFGYDASTGRMTQYQFNVNGQALVGTLTWNANSTLQKLIVSDPFNSTDNQTCNYGYDDVNRVGSANCGTVWSQTFGYDAFGNLTKGGNMPFQPVYTNPTTGQNTNRFISIPGITVSYDSDGNVLSDGSHTYAWDADGNSVTIDAVGLTYDALDRMVEQNRAGTYNQIVYAPTGKKLALMNGQNLLKAFLSLPGGKSEAVYTSSGLSGYRHKDWVGSARLDSTPTRTVSSTTAYAPFGETYAQSGTADPSFTGQNQDTVAGLYDFPAREYSTQGRWPSPDPGGLSTAHSANPQSWNRYAYVRNNPLNLTDPTGLDCIYDNEDGTVTVVRGDCIDGQNGLNNGVFVDGTVDTKSGITFDPSTGDLTFGLSNDSGGYGTGIATGFFDPQVSPNNSLMPALGQAYNLGIGPMNVMSVVFVAEVGGIVAIEATPAVVAGYTGAKTGAAALTAAASPGVWQNIYDFSSGFANANRIPTTPMGNIGFTAGRIFRSLIGQ